MSEKITVMVAICTNRQWPNECPILSAEFSTLATNDVNSFLSSASSSATIDGANSRGVQLLFSGQLSKKKHGKLMFTFNRTQLMIARVHITSVGNEILQTGDLFGALSRGWTLQAKLWKILKASELRPAELSHSSVERIRNDDPKHSYPVVSRMGGWCPSKIGVNLLMCLSSLFEIHPMYHPSTSWTPLQWVDCKTPWPWFHSIPIYPRFSQDFPQDFPKFCVLQPLPTTDLLIFPRLK